jgi:hypothetical protein
MSDASKMGQSAVEFREKSLGTRLLGMFQDEEYWPTFEGRRSGVPAQECGRVESVDFRENRVAESGIPNIDAPGSTYTRESGGS